MMPGMVVEDTAAVATTGTAVATMDTAVATTDTQEGATTMGVVPTETELEVCACKHNSCSPVRFKLSV